MRKRLIDFDESSDPDEFDKFIEDFLTRQMIQDGYDEKAIEALLDDFDSYE